MPVLLLDADGSVHASRAGASATPLPLIDDLGALARHCFAAGLTELAWERAIACVEMRILPLARAMAADGPLRLRGAGWLGWDAHAGLQDLAPVGQVMHLDAIEQRFNEVLAPSAAARLAATLGPLAGRYALELVLVRECLHHWRAAAVVREAVVLPSLRELPADSPLHRVPPEPVLAHVGLGANLGDAPAALRGALDALRKAPGVLALRASRLYRSAPVDAAGPAFYNAVAELQTRLSPVQLLALLQSIEQAAGRERPWRNAPRTLDLDLLLYADVTSNEPALQLPHPRMLQRAFVLQPLREIAPDRVSAAALAAVADQTLTPLESAVWP